MSTSLVRQRQASIGLRISTSYSPDTILPWQRVDITLSTQTRPAWLLFKTWAWITTRLREWAVFPSVPTIALRMNGTRSMWEGIPIMVSLSFYDSQCCIVCAIFSIPGSCLNFVAFAALGGNGRAIAEAHSDRGQSWSRSSPSKYLLSLFPGKSFFLFVVPLACLQLLIVAVIVGVAVQLLSLVDHSILYYP